MHVHKSIKDAKKYFFVMYSFRLDLNSTRCAVAHRAPPRGTVSRYIRSSQVRQEPDTWLGRALRIVMGGAGTMLRRQTGKCMFTVVSIDMYACHFIQNFQISKIFKISKKSEIAVCSPFFSEYTNRFRLSIFKNERLAAFPASR